MNFRLRFICQRKPEEEGGMDSSRLTSPELNRALIRPQWHSECGSVRAGRDLSDHSVLIPQLLLMRQPDLQRATQLDSDVGSISPGLTTAVKWAVWN